MMKKKIIIAAGGTGGHIYPAMALAEQLGRIIPRENILFVGGKLDENRYFDSSVAHRSVACGSFVKKRPCAIFQSMGNIGKGIWQSYQIIREFKPDLTIGFGSYYSLPPLIASKMASVPFLLHEANSIPGKVIRLLSRQALVTGVHFPQTRLLLKGKTVEVGMPLRNGYRRTKELQKEAEKYFNFNPHSSVLLIFGGSQGAQALNQHCLDAILKCKDKSSVQILHFTGNATATEHLDSLYRENGVSAIVKSFEKRMDLAWSLADLVISRSGAGTIAELLAFEVPAILIPFPFAADNHQEYNADFLADEVKGGLKLLERNLNPIVFSRAIETVLQDKEGFRFAIENYKQSWKGIDFCELVKDILASDCVFRTTEDTSFS